MTSPSEVGHWTSRCFASFAAGQSIRRVKFVVLPNEEDLILTPSVVSYTHMHPLPSRSRSHMLERSDTQNRRLVSDWLWLPVLRCKGNVRDRSTPVATTTHTTPSISRGLHISSVTSSPNRDECMAEQGNEEHSLIEAQHQKVAHQGFFPGNSTRNELDPLHHPTLMNIYECIKDVLAYAIALLQCCIFSVTYPLLSYVHSAISSTAHPWRSGFESVFARTLRYRSVRPK
ncbi:uncharacterized protein EI90DRAFT_1875813 [Cantharellus anzutake]|uniref:uncharacterized protein n=1 Tax=Cantharellus anzutake TaxID=1750568 RepID=UPI0019076B78|nr:uncharacterized protein EI90DRAFT_1875813 [Cantharellus anzutake]KAF8326825.1 hypothetical protein EI90DRAFT_1875813 [Cantharellus anzutake]